MARRRSTLTVVCLLLCGCGVSPRDDPLADHLELDSLGSRVVEAHRARDPEALAALHTDSVMFEWRGGSTSHGRADFEARMRRNWVNRGDLDFEFDRSTRRVGSEYATEVHAYRETWRSHPDTVTSEYGRYVLFMARQSDGRWLIERWIGFTDSVVQAYQPR